MADAPRDSVGYTAPTSFGWRSGGVAYRYMYRGLLLNYSGDGLTDGLNNTNGVRTLTSTNSSWTVPDPYSGVPTSPQSQKAYVYAANNPASNSDSSGYLTTAQTSTLSRYFNKYSWGTGPTDCTLFMLQAYRDALGIDINALVSQDYYGTNRGSLIDYASVIVKGYELNGYRGGTPGAWAPNLRNYFLRMGELHLWTGNSGMQVGDILFVGPLVSLPLDQSANSMIDVDHVAVVTAVGASGQIVKIAEGTGRDGTTVEKSWNDFLKAMQAQGVDIESFGRLKAALAAWKLYEGTAFAEEFAGDGGWVTPGNENLRCY